eukprot:scaffold112109_cov28-Tisochrysis_lutea.AAC.1
MSFLERTLQGVVAVHVQHVDIRACLQELSHCRHVPRARRHVECGGTVVVDRVHRNTRIQRMSKSGHVAVRGGEHQVG